MGHSGTKPEELVDETDFACRSGLCQDAVAASDHAHDLKAFDGSHGSFHPLEATRWLDDALERTVIGLNDVVQIL